MGGRKGVWWEGRRPSQAAGSRRPPSFRRDSGRRASRRGCGLGTTRQEDVWRAEDRASGCAAGVFLRASQLNSVNVQCDQWSTPLFSTSIEQPWNSSLKPSESARNSKTDCTLFSNTLPNFREFSFHSRTPTALFTTTYNGSLVGWLKTTGGWRNSISFLRMWVAAVIWNVTWLNGGWFRSATARYRRAPHRILEFKWH